MLQARIAAATIVAVSLLSPWMVDASSWPRFRGPNGTGVANNQNLPDKWDMKQHLLWKVPIPGVGHSSPIVWDDRLFLQTSSANANERSLMCIDVRNGATLWQYKLPAIKGKVENPRGSQASSTPAVDAERVYVVFWDGKGQVIKAFTHKGDEVWSKELGSFKAQHGAGASPIVYEDMVIFNRDQDDAAELLCFEAKSGKIVWREERPFFRACYAAPFIRDLPQGKKELVVATTLAVTGYDPVKGTRNWNFEWNFSKAKFPLRITCSPVIIDGMLLACSGDGGGDRHMVAVKLGETPKMVWENYKDFPYVPCPLALGKHIYFVNDKCFAGCYEAATGNRVWFERLEGREFVSSPVMVDGKIFIANSDGDVFVFPASPTFKLLAKNALGEQVQATPAVADGRMYIRGAEHLFCIGKKR